MDLENWNIIQEILFSEKSINFSGIDKIHSKYDSISGSILKDKREPIFYSFSQDKPPCHELFRNIKIKHHKKIKSNISDITFHFEDDKNRKADFNGGKKTIFCN